MNYFPWEGKMSSFKTLLASAALLAFIGAAQAQYKTVLTFEDMISPIAGDPETLAASVNNGTTSFHAIKRSGPTESWIVKVDGFNTGSPSASLLFDWGASNLNPGRAFGLAGNDLVIGDGTDDAVYKIDTTTGVRTDYLTKAQLFAQTGGDSIQGNSSIVRPDGELVFYELDTDALWVTNGAGSVTEFLSNEALVNATGSDSVSSQIALDDGGDYYYGNSSTDSIYVIDNDVPVVTPGDNILELVTGDMVSAVTGNASVSYGDMIFNPTDGLIYVRELISRTFVSFDPDDPAGTIAAVLTRDQLEAGPAESAFTIGPFSLVDGQLAWSLNAFSSGVTGYYTIPEPSTLLMLTLIVPMFRRR